MKPLDLAQLPSLLQPLLGPSKRLGAEIWVKRDDLTGLGLSGNKVRNWTTCLQTRWRKGRTA